MSIPHGTRSKYTNHGCRCDLCRAANTRYKNEFRAKHGRGLNEYSSKQIRDLIEAAERRRKKKNQIQKD